MVTQYERADPTGSLLSDLPKLLNRFFDQLLDLINTQYELFKTELKEGVTAYGMRALTFGVGAIVALLGFVLLNLAVVFWLNLAVRSLAASFAIVGFVDLTIGSIGAFITAKRFGAQRLFRESKRELERDKEWIKTESRTI